MYLHSLSTILNTAPGFGRVNELGITVGFPMLKPHNIYTSKACPIS